jgi:hypothetical protein
MYRISNRETSKVSAKSLGRIVAEFGLVMENDTLIITWHHLGRPSIDAL